MKTLIIEELEEKTLLKVEKINDDTIHFITTDLNCISMRASDGAPNDVNVYN